MGLFDTLGNLYNGVEALQKAATGNIGGALHDLFNMQASHHGLSAASIAWYWMTPTPVMGGVPPAVARLIHEQLKMIHYAKKNLFLVELTDLSPVDAFDSWAFNLLVTDVSYAPVTIPSERAAVGSASLDKVSTSEAVEMRLTTMDDADGTVRKWFRAKADRIAHKDGTVGVPIDYLVKIRVLHNFVTNFTGLEEGYEDSYLMRPTNSEYELSRREDALQELTLTFSQFDTFMPT